jgi:hypothetical protein
MTARGLLNVLLRRWYLVLLGASISMAGLGIALSQPGVYWTQVDVVVLAPPDAVHPNRLQGPRFAETEMAGLMVGDFNQGDRPMLMASSDTTLFGEGVRRGIQVRLPNNGSQWRPLYVRPSIDVQVVDSSPERVERESSRIIAQLLDILESRQNAFDVPPALRMTAMASPQDPVIHYVTGSRMRLVPAFGLLGACLTTIAVYWVDRWLLRFHRRSKLPQEEVLSPVGAP